MRALLAQLCPRPGEVEANLTRAAEVVSSHPEVDLAVFPELFASGYRVDDLDPVAIDADAGDLAAVYRKTHLFGAENGSFTPGESLTIVRLAGRDVAPLVCFDVEFPEPAREAAAAGADLLVTVAANMEPEGREQELATGARALENRVPHLYVNRCGAEGGLEFAGGTRAIDADGAVTAAPGSGRDR